MSARSSAPRWLTLVSGLVAAAACGGPPEADPAKVVALAKAMINDQPPPGYTDCTGEQVIGGATMTLTTLLKLGQDSIDQTPERAEWVNPHELDSPAARVLIDPKASERDQRRAAAELLAAPFFLVYRVDLVSAPMALMLKELKRGTVGARAIRYDKRGSSVCVRVFHWQNDATVSQWAIDKSVLPVIDPKVARALQEDLRAEMLKRVAALGAPPPRYEIAPKTPDNMRD